MPPEVNDSEQITKKRISLGELREYMTSPARVAEDVVATNGVILLPRGTSLASLLSSVDDVEKNLQRWGITSIPIIIQITLDNEGLDNIMKSVRGQIEDFDPQLAKHAVEQVSSVYSRIGDGTLDSEGYATLVQEGRILAQEVSQAKQVMLCLGRVRSWDEYTYVHSLNVALLGGVLANRLYPGRTEVAECMSIGGILHDLGKARIPKEVLNKPGALTKDEFEIIKKHTEFGEELAVANGVTDPWILAVIRGHHERYNGEGYPDRLMKEQIRKEGRIAAVADVFDALTARRVYKEPIESRVAVSMMIENMGTHFDPEVVRTLLLLIGLYPPGTLVRLSDESLGVVVGSRGKDLMRPQVLLRVDSMGRKVEGIKIVDLSMNPPLHIQQPLEDFGKLDLTASSPA
ncbi:MAG: HD-GYP domain-containing protein [Synergistaceae bacterium]|jgi:HD-GYP domain-containing protein (c-di-GMP phosphodiesterase class II)|nr:HD-GYP domain-containing protein [Synergistaceae bacterium]